MLRVMSLFLRRTTSARDLVDHVTFITSFITEGFTKVVKTVEIRFKGFCPTIFLLLEAFISV